VAFLVGHQVYSYVGGFNFAKDMRTIFLRQDCAEYAFY